MTFKHMNVISDFQDNNCEICNHDIVIYINNNKNCYCSIYNLFSAEHNDLTRHKPKMFIIPTIFKFNSDELCKYKKN